MTGPSVAPPMDWNAWFGNSKQHTDELNASWDRVMQYYNQFAAMEGQGHNTTPVPTPPQTMPWAAQHTDEDLVGAAMHWGLPEDLARQIPRDQLIQFVQHKRDAAGPQVTEFDASKASTWLAGLAPMEMLGIGAGEAITGGLEKLPGIGDWLARGGLVHDADMKLRQMEEAVRSSVPSQVPQGFLSAYNVAGNMGATFYPGVAAWAVAGKAGKIIPYASRLSPMGHAMLQGGLAAYLLQGGTSDADTEAQAWEHRIMTFGTGAILGGAGKALGDRVMSAYVARAARRGGGPPPEPPLGLGAVGAPEPPAVPGNFQPAVSTASQDVYDLAAQGDPQALEFVRAMGGDQGGPRVVPQDLGGGQFPEQGLMRGPTNTPQVGLAPEQSPFAPEVGLRPERINPFMPEQGQMQKVADDLYYGPNAVAVQANAANHAEDLAVQMNKAGTVIQSPMLPEIGSQPTLSDVDVARAAYASNPGGTNIVQGVADPPAFMQQIGPNATFALRNGRLDALISDTPIMPWEVAEYEQHGMFTNQKVSTPEGLPGRITSIDKDGNALIEPEYSGSVSKRHVSQLHPWLTSPKAVEAPKVWEDFSAYADARAAETQAAMGGALTPEQVGNVRIKNQPIWMESFFNERGITDPGDRDRLRAYFNQRWVDTFKDQAPVEVAQQQAATAELGQVAGRPLPPVQQLDWHAQGKGYIAVPGEGDRWTLISRRSATGGPPSQMNFESREAAETWVKQINPELEDITPASEVPIELTAVHPVDTMQLPNTNELALEHTLGAAREADAMAVEAGGAPPSEPPEVAAAMGNLGKLRSRVEAAYSNHSPIRRIASALDQILFEHFGESFGTAADWEKISRNQNLYHTAMEPFSKELADLLAPVKEARKISGEWATAYETLDPAERAAFVAKHNWAPKEIESLDRYDQLMQAMFPETGLDEIRQIPRYFSHIASRQSVPETFPRAFEDFNLSKTTEPFWKYARTGNLNFREMDPRQVGDAYIRAVMWDKYMAEDYNAVVAKWKALIQNRPEVEPAANFMTSWLDIIKHGYHPSEDYALNTMHDALKVLIDPTITREQAREVVLGGLNSSYAGMLGYRPHMIARHFLQMTYAIPRAGTDLIGTLARFATSAADREAILTEAVADGAIAPRSFTRNAPGAFTGELERVEAGIGRPGPAGTEAAVDHTLRYKAIGAIRTAVLDALPDALKGAEDSVLQPMGAFSKAVERFRAIVYVAGKQKAARALATFRQVESLERVANGVNVARPLREEAQTQLARLRGSSDAMDNLMGDSMMRTFDPAWQREFQQRVGLGAEQDNETAAFVARQFADATFFKYGVGQSPWISKSVTGRIAVQLGHYPLNYYQFLRESLQNGTPADKAKLLASMGTTTAGLMYASKKTGWNLNWLNPWFALSMGEGGPLLGMVVAGTTGIKHMIEAAQGNDPRGTRFQEGQSSMGEVFRQASQFAPWGGIARDVQAAHAVGSSPQPGLTALNWALTGATDNAAEVNRAAYPQAEAAFQQSLQQHSNPVRAGGVGLPPGYAPQQPVIDPPLIQDPRAIPATVPASGTTVPSGFGVSPGGVESVPSYNPFPQFRRR